jgi:hypothetical protein
MLSPLLFQIREWNQRILTYLLTELGPSWEVEHCAATQELPSILWNPKVHYRVHKSPPQVPILSPIDPLHVIPSYLSKIYSNIVNPYVLVFLVVSFLLAFLPISYMHSSSLHPCYMHCPSLWNQSILVKKGNTRITLRSSQVAIGCYLSLPCMQPTQLPGFGSSDCGGLVGFCFSSPGPQMLSRG